MLEPRKRTALDGKVWWCVFDNKNMKWSTYTYFGQYKTKKACQFAIDYYTKERGRQMDKKEIEIIRKMVIYGLYKMCLMNKLDSAMFRKLKDEQNRLFDNYILNRELVIEDNE